MTRRRILTDEQWQPISTAPKDGTDILTLVICASVPVVHIAYWDDGEDWEVTGHDSREEAMGWWSFVRHSVTQEKLDDHLTPTHWMPVPPLPPETNT